MHLRVWATLGKHQQPSCAKNQLIATPENLSVEATAYVRALYEASGIKPKDAIDWYDLTETQYGLFGPLSLGCKDSGLNVKFPSRSTWRNLVGISLTMYGIGIESNRKTFMQPNHPREIWAWDEISFFKYESNPLWLGAKGITTNKFSLVLAIEESQNLEYYSRWVICSSMARHAVGLPPPMMENPISPGITRALGIDEELFKGGFPSFEHYTNEQALQACAQILKDETKTAMENDLRDILPPD